MREREREKKRVINKIGVKFFSVEISNKIQLWKYLILKVRELLRAKQSIYSYTEHCLLINFK